MTEVLPLRYRNLGVLSLKMCFLATSVRYEINKRLLLWWNAYHWMSHFCLPITLRNSSLRWQNGSTILPCLHILYTHQPSYAIPHPLQTQFIFGVRISLFSSLMPLCKSSKVRMLNSTAVQLYTHSHTKERNLKSQKHSIAVPSEFKGTLHF